MISASARKRDILLAGVSLLPLLVGCDSIGFRDALAAGVFDFVAGTIADLLANVFPVADLLSTCCA